MPHPNHTTHNNSKVISAPLTLDNRHPEQKGLRWNPLFGTYVNISTAENDLTCEIQEENWKAHYRAVDKVTRREGELDPIFWRDRKTGTCKPDLPKIMPSKRPLSAKNGIIPAHAKDEVKDLLHTTYFYGEGPYEEEVGAEEEEEVILHEDKDQGEGYDNRAQNENNQQKKNIKKSRAGGFPFIKTGIDGLPLSPSKQEKVPMSDHRNRDHVNVLLHDDMRENIGTNDTVTFDCSAKALRKRRDNCHIDHVKSLIHQIKNPNATSKECGEAQQKFKRITQLGHLSRQGTISSLLHIEDNAPLPPDRYFYDSYGNRHFVSAAEEEKIKLHQQYAPEGLGLQDINTTTTHEVVHNPDQYDNNNATTINNSYVSKRQIKDVDPRVISSNGEEGFKPVLFYDAPPTRKNEEVAGIVKRIPVRGKSNKPGESLAPIPTSRDDSIGGDSADSAQHIHVSNTSDHVIFGGQGSANINDEHSSKYSSRKVMNACKKDSSKDWFVHHDDSETQVKGIRSRPKAASYMKSVSSQDLEDARLIYEKSLDPNAIDNNKGISEVGGKDHIMLLDTGTETNLKNAVNAKNYVQRRPSWMDHDKNRVKFDLEQANHKPIATPRPAWLDHEACLSKNE